MPQETLNFESIGKDGETPWRLSLTPYKDTGNFSIMIMKGRTEGLAYMMTPKEAHDLAIEILSAQGYSSFS